MPQRIQFQMFIQTLTEMLAADREHKVAERKLQSRTKAHRFLNRPVTGAKAAGQLSAERADVQDPQYCP